MEHPSLNIITRALEGITEFTVLDIKKSHTPSLNEAVIQMIVSFVCPSTEDDDYDISSYVSWGSVLGR